MPLIKDDALVEDRWLSLGEGEPLPDDAPPVISLERWQSERDSLIRRNGPLGIRLKSDQSPALIAEDLDRFDLVALEFPKFTDGRAYSYARLLRERYGFEREVRAVGNVLRDQWVFMVRCGFDAIEAADEADLQAWLQAKREISVVYQPGSDRRRPALALRSQGSESPDTQSKDAEEHQPTGPVALPPFRRAELARHNDPVTLSL